MTVADSNAPAIAVQGDCPPQFAPLREAFAANFRELNELGAAVSVFVEGEKVVDLWGGHMDAGKTRPWERNTIVTMASTMKGMLAVTLAMLADRGAIDYERPVADYWPEFAQGGKDKVLVREAVGHHASIPYADASQAGDFFRYEKMVAAIAKQQPEWPVGTRGVYHTFNIIFILEKLIEAASGEPAWDFFRREVAAALGVDFHFRMGPQEMARFSPDLDTEAFMAGSAASPEVMARFMKPMGDIATALSPEEMATVPTLMSGGNARGCAQLFAYLSMDGAIGDKRILSNKTLAQLTQVQWYEPCAVWGTPMRTALGVLLNDPKFFYIGPNPDAFGTAGAGGSFAMADRQNRIAVGYSLNRWWPALALGDRARRVVDAVYASLPRVRGVG